MANVRKMPEGKYGPYIVTDFYDQFELSPERTWEKAIMGRGILNGKRRGMEHMVWMDTNVVPGAFYAEAVWFWPPSMTGIVVTPPKPGEKPHAGIPPHSHPFPELLSFYGTDTNHPNELNCEVEFWIEDEKYIFDKSFVVYVPENITHCPLHMHNMTRPIFHFTMGPGLEYNH
jgi:hypothetical protein